MASSTTASAFYEQSDAIDFREIGSLLRRRSGIVVGFVVFTTALALFYVLFAVPQFTSSGMIYLGDAQSNAGPPNISGSNLNFLSDYTNESDVETQIELITSEALVKDAILETGLNAQIQSGAAGGMTFWRWKLFHGGGIAAYQPQSDTLQVLNAETPGSYRVVLGENGTYELLRRGGLFQPDRVISSGKLGEVNAATGLTIMPVFPEFTGRPGQVYNLIVTSADGLADGLLGGALSVNAGGSATQPTKIAFVKFRWNNPYQAQIFLNQVMNDFIINQLSWKTQSASTTQNFVSDQLKKVSASLAAADQKLAAYQSQTGIVDVTQNSQTTVTQLNQYQTQRTNLQLQIYALTELDHEMHTKEGQLNPYLVSQTNDTVLATLTNNLADAELKLSQARVQYTDDSDEVKLQQSNVDKLQQSIRTIIDNDLRSSQQGLVSMDKILANYDDRVKTLPAESLNVIALQRSSNVLGQLYGELMQKEEEAEVSKAATIINTRIVTPAQIPLYATSPKGFITVVFGAFVGLVLGGGLIFARYAFSGLFETSEQIRNSTALSISGEIPKQIKTNLAEDVLIGRGRQRFTEAFRLLRGSIYRVFDHKQPMVILVTSASAGDGKTTVAVNLAKVLAEDLKRVVFVNADFYSEFGRLPSKNNETKTVWLKEDGEPLLRDWPDERFKFLSIEEVEPSSAAALNKVISERIFTNLRRHFDYIIVDCPPLPAVSDVMTLAGFGDLILSVVRLSHTRRRLLTAHNELLSTLNVPHGLVINYVETDPSERNKYSADDIRPKKLIGKNKGVSPSY